MAANNLRIIYKNLADTATISASSTVVGTSVDNLKKDTKSLIWRATGTTATLTITFSSPQIVGGIVLPFCNLSSTATIRIVASGIDYTTLACPYAPLNTWDWGALPLGVNAYSYGGKSYARVWLPNKEQVSLSSLTITITDTANTSGYIEASRLVIGAYWSPTYNTSFGISAGIRDLSENNRADSGDLITNRGTMYNTLSFDLKYMNSSDRTSLVNLFKGVGITKPLLISLFPDDEDTGKEQLHQVYGKMSKTIDVSHPTFGIYSSSIDIEEI